MAETRPGTLKPLLLLAAAALGSTVPGCGKGEVPTPGSRIPPGLTRVFDVPEETGDQHGNSVKIGTDDKTGWALEIRHKPSGIHLVFVPAGEFGMGSPQDENGRNDNETHHRVRITKPFYLGKYEVTRGEFARFVKLTRHDAGNSWRQAVYQEVAQDTDEHPVVFVSWDDALAFCQWMGGRMSDLMRLPTEAEWEYACRAGTETAYHWGDKPDDGRGWCNGADQTARKRWKDWTVSGWDDGYAFTAPVGRFKPNAFGLYDMHGNVLEWCQDWFGEYPGRDAVDPTGVTQGQSRVLRGGSWYDKPSNLRSAGRAHRSPDSRNNCTIGFRVAIGLK